MVTRAISARLILGFVLGAVAVSAQSQITCVQPPSGILAWWSFDETGGPTAAELIGGRVGTYFGTPPPVPAPGEVTNALLFNGSTSFVGVANNPVWAFGIRDFSIELWAKFSVAQGGSVGEPAAILIGNDDGPGNQNKWFFGVGGGYLYFHINSPTLGPQFFPLAPFSPTVNTWYHLAVTRSGSLYQVYINGTLAASATNAAAVPGASAFLTIGEAESIGFMNGQLDEVAIYNRALTVAEVAAIAAAGSAGKCKGATGPQLQIQSVSPTFGGNTGKVTVSIRGTGFETNATVNLVNGSQVVAPGLQTTRLSPTQMETTFDLTGLSAQDALQVQVTNPDPAVAAFPFSIVSGGLPHLNLQLVGPATARVGRTTPFVALLTNTGAINAPLAAVSSSVSCPPSPATPVVVQPIINPQPVFDVPLLPIQVPILSPTALLPPLPLIALQVPTGVPVPLQIPIQIPVSPGGPCTVHVEVSWADPPPDPFDPTNPADCSEPKLEDAILNAIVDKLKEAITMAANDYVQLGCDGINPQNTQECAEVADAGSKAQDAIKTITDILSQPPFPQCIPDPGTPPAPDFPFPDVDALDQILTPVLSWDPNAKSGPAGFGNPGFVSGSLLPYTIFFENLAAATAPAQQITTIDPLDPSIDPNTVSLISLNLGGSTYDLGGGSHVSRTFDLRPATNVLLQVQADVDSIKRQIAWALNALDPATLQLPTDSQVGILPPNQTPPQGEGYVTFTTAANQNLGSGTVIPNQATVTFDVNPPIQTNVWTNTLDTTPPVSHVLVLPANESGLSFPIVWSGSDVGSGVASFSVYVSDNGGQFTPWQTGITQTSANFAGTAGHIYAFYSIATDNVGNTEPAKSAGEATTTVPVSSQTITFNPLPNVTYGTAPISLLATASSGLAVSYSVSGPAALSGSTLSITGVGTVTVTASQAGNSGYTAAPSVVQSFTVSQALLTVTANNASSVFGQPLPSFTYTITGFVNSDSTSLVSGSAAEATTATSTSAPGTYPITFTTPSLSAANYTFSYITGTLTISSATQTITFSPLPNVTYGAVPFVLTATASSGLPVSYAVTGPVLLSGSSLTIAGAGNVTVTASQAGNANYSAATSVSHSFAVNPATLTVTANSASITAGQPLPALTYAITGFVNQDTSAVVSGTATETTTATSASAPGVYPITFATQALSAANYSLVYVRGTLTILSGASQTITFNPLPNVNFGVPPFTLSAIASSGLPITYISLTMQVCTVSGATVTVVAVGACSIEATQSGNSIYAAAVPVTRSFSVLSRAASFTIQPVPAVETIKRGQVAAFALQLRSLSGFVGNVSLACAGGPPQSKCLNFPMVVKLNGTAVAVSGIAFPKGAAPGTYVMTFTGVSGQQMSSATASFILQ